jgi:hypothetical protein
MLRKPRIIYEEIPTSIFFLNHLVQILKEGGCRSGGPHGPRMSVGQFADMAEFKEKILSEF